MTQQTCFLKTMTLTAIQKRDERGKSIGLLQLKDDKDSYQGGNSRDQEEKIVLKDVTGRLA